MPAPDTNVAPFGACSVTFWSGAGGSLRGWSTKPGAGASPELPTGGSEEQAPRLQVTVSGWAEGRGGARESLDSKSDGPRTQSKPDPSVALGMMYKATQFRYL